MTDASKCCRDFLFRALTFESEADAFRAAGIRVGANLADTENALIVEKLAPFGIQRRNDAIEMARLYAVLFCFENEVRDLIRERLTEKIGDEWWLSIPKKVKDLAESRQNQAMKDSWLDGEKRDPLSFCDFGCLADIIVAHWEQFEDIIPTQHWLKQRMDELEKARNFVAHNRKLLPSEFERIYMYIADWNKVVGL